MTNAEKIRAEFEEWYSINGFKHMIVKLYAENAWKAALATRHDVNQELVEAFAELIEGAELHDEDDDLRPLTKWDCFLRAKQALAKYKGEKHE